ncbi:MAG TPA: 4-(cytidine 5'-diphospho)-2-C-methyl-D-erythritol kinase [Telluria sp.]|nr:4-(cytidine 5'-diphospho)-2-C-methyl-D-erythritol kinase [Telluria sp.]
MTRRSLHNCPAPAKLNLFLHVTGRRADGYHLLQSVFQLIGRADLLHFDLREDGEIRRLNDVPGVPEQHDLVVRALQALQAETLRRHGGAPRGISVTVDKRLPMGGGLGGGSSDAATALMAANHLWQAGFSNEELAAIGLPLGADIPFFLFGRTAFVEGVGEAMREVDVPPCWYVVIEPGVQVPTGPVFSAGDLTRDSKAVTIADFSRHIGQRKDLEQFGRNDLQPVATRLFPQVAQAVEWLARFGDARMTGSGACVFCALSSESEADAVLEKAAGVWTAWKAESLARHPMLALLQREQVVE